MVERIPPLGNRKREGTYLCLSLRDVLVLTLFKILYFLRVCMSVYLHEFLYTHECVQVPGVARGYRVPWNWRSSCEPLQVLCGSSKHCEMLPVSPAF